MTEDAEPAPPPPRCTNCGAPLVRTALPGAALGPPQGLCVDCADAGPAEPVAWACPRCGMVVVRDA